MASLRILRAFWSWLADTLEVINFSWKEAASTAAVSGVITWSIGMLTDVNPFYLAIGVPVAVAAFLAVSVFSSVKDALKKPLPITDAEMSEWIGHQSYYVWVIACLCVNVKPTPVINQNHPAYPTLQKIKGEIEKGSVKTMYSGGGIRAKLERLEVFKLVGFLNAKPKFLYPD
jgi:hypothetical protein